MKWSFWTRGVSEGGINGPSIYHQASCRLLTETLFLERSYGHQRSAYPHVLLKVSLEDRERPLIGKA